MKATLSDKHVFFSSVFILFLFVTVSPMQAAITIQSQEAVGIELKGYAGLSENILFTGNLTVGVQSTIDIPYHGLALLDFEKGQSYPLILGEQSFTLKIKNPAMLPSFEGNTENEYFYKLLKGTETEPGQYHFARLMIQAKQLLDSSHSIHTVTELSAMKKKFHSFVRTHYQDLQHSDMLIRLLAQYFMMHEYIDFHNKAAPASDIQVRYKNAVIDGVGNWLEILKEHIPEHEILNYCVSLYYNRSMVSLAHLIVSSFRDIAYCSGELHEPAIFPEKLLVIDKDGNNKGVLSDFRNDTLIAFVSSDCPVSMTEAVVKARQLAAQKNDAKLIVAPLPQLSVKHRAMPRMLSKSNMFFINDEKWIKENIANDIRLPMFVLVGTSGSQTKALK